MDAGTVIAVIVLIIIIILIIWAIAAAVGGGKGGKGYGKGNNGYNPYNPDGSINPNLTIPATLTTKAAWTSDPANGANILSVGQQIESPNGAYAATLLASGALVVYNVATKTILWYVPTTIPSIQPQVSQWGAMLETNGVIQIIGNISSSNTVGTTASLLVPWTSPAGTVPSGTTPVWTAFVSNAGVLTVTGTDGATGWTSGTTPGVTIPAA